MALNHWFSVISIAFVFAFMYSLVLHSRDRELVGDYLVGGIDRSGSVQVQDCGPQLPNPGP